MDADGTSSKSASNMAKTSTTPISDIVDLTLSDDQRFHYLSPPENWLRSPVRHIKTESQEIIEVDLLPDLQLLTEVPLQLPDEGLQLPQLDNNFENDMLRMLDEYNTNAAAPEHVLTSSEDEYEAAKSAYERKEHQVKFKKKAGKSVDDDEVVLWRLKAAFLKAKKEKAKEEARQKHAQKIHSMFVEETDDDEEELLPPATPTLEEAMNSDGPKTTTMNEPVYVSDTGAERSDRDTKRGKKHQQKPRKTSDNARSRVQKKTSGGCRIVRRTKSPIMLNVGSLMRNNIVADAQANQGAYQQPTFATRKKRDALAALIASIPPEHQSTGRGMKTKLNDACKQFKWQGRGSMQPDGAGGWRLKGMATSLKHFQLLSAAWGCAREAGSDAPYGGILADTMGYGKTVQALTIMVENQPKANAKNRTTLIICPASICMQWMEEIGKHLEDGLMESVLIWRSGHRLQGVNDEDVCKQLRRYSVVITTYHEIMRQYPKCEPPPEMISEKGKDDWWRAYYEKNKGPFLRMPFFRVILDEAQITKNHESRTSKACRLLTSKYRWVITGTPLSNCLEELYSYFDFLGVEGAGNFQQFKKNFGKRNDLSIQRLDAILRKIMIRRTGSDRMFGAPLTSLPALDHRTISLNLNPVEKAIYSIVRQRFITRINDWSAAGRINQLSRSIFVMLLRLRQMCAHVLMASTTIRDLLEVEDIEKLWKLVERYAIQGANGTSSQQAVVLKKILRSVKDEKAETRATRVTGSSTDNSIDLTINDADFDYRSLFYKLQHEGAWDRIRKRSVCHQCNDVPESPRLSIPCNHLFCSECITILMESGQVSKVEASCPVCQGPILGSANMTAMEQIAMQAGCRTSYIPPELREGKKKKKIEEFEWLSINGAHLMSTKVQAISSTIDEWITKDAEAKIVVFTLFIPMVKVLAKLCQQRGWGYQEYTGQVSADQRNRALQYWKDRTKDHKLLLMSMRAGGLGLNLVESSYVIIVDPWWNEPAEDQAFSRVYRIGQKKDCVVRRFVINDAVDTQLMLHLQRLKAQECDRVIDGRSQQELTIPDLLRLFGTTRQDPETGGITIQKEDDEEVDEFIIADDQMVVDDSEVEETRVAPARPL